MDGTDRSPSGALCCPHLAAAVCAVLAAAALLAGLQWFVRGRLPGLLAFYSAHAVPIKVNGTLLPRAAFRASDELSVYGSSELDVWSLNRADAFFRHRPTGFAVFGVGRGGASCLSILQKLAAAGDAARGRKVVIFLSPVWFLEPDVKSAALDANLGVSQLGAWIFGADLSPGLKTAIAQRMRQLPDKLKNQALLEGGVRCLATPDTFGQVGFALLAPFGKFQNALMETLESCAILREIVDPQRRWQNEGERDQAAPPVTAGQIDWDNLGTAPGADDRRYVYHTKYRPEVRPRDFAGPRLPPPAGGDRAFVAQVEHSREFDDLELLVRVLREQQMEAFFISQPFNGSLRDQMQISTGARRVYYARLETVLGKSGYPLRDFSEREEDPSFFADAEHPSARAWLFYDREIDAFYSGTTD